MAQPKALLKGFARDVDRLKPDSKKRITKFDPEQRGLCVRVTPNGRKTFTLVVRDPNGKQVWAAIGDADLITVTEARELAREGIKRIKTGIACLREAGACSGA